VNHLDFEVGPFTVLFGKNNAGKTNTLEAIYGVLAPTDMPGHFAGDTLARGVRGAEDNLPPMGAVYAQLEWGQSFDDEVLSVDPGTKVDLASEYAALDLGRLPAGQVAFIGYFDQPGVMFSDPASYFLHTHKILTDHLVDSDLDESFQSACILGPRPRPLFVDWEFDDIDERVTAAIIAALPRLSGRPELGTKLFERTEAGTPDSWQLRPEVRRVVSAFSMLATALLPDFVDGSVYAHFEIPTNWDATPLIHVGFQERGEKRAEFVENVGRGAARWIAASIQIALRVLEHAHEIAAEPGEGLRSGAFSGHVLFIDEPEAHLHPSAVQSIVRWCQRMVSSGFNVVVASHHEEFLRVTGGGQTLVHVTRDPKTGITHAQTLPSLRTTRLLELAADIGMHPASALSIRRAILFVEGTLDEAVLDEYAGLELDSAGVKIIPIHGTKNLEGLVAVELATELGIKTGILTDDTNPATMYAKARGRRSGEEKKVIDVIQIAQEKGLPVPAVFGVPEKDLLFALPADAIREHLGGPFPGWKEVVAECRQSLGKTPSDTVHWKQYAAEQYGLRIDTPGGVRDLIRALDLANVPLPSIRTAVDQIIDWANSDD